jgi:hypothetical protein
LGIVLNARETNPREPAIKDASGRYLVAFGASGRDCDANQANADRAIGVASMEEPEASASS